MERKSIECCFQQAGGPHHPQCGQQWAFQACGFFTGQTGVEGGGVGSGSSGWPARGCPSPTPSSASYEQVKMDDGKRLQKVRDGQELDYGAAISLLQAMGVNSVLGGQQGRVKRERYFR